MKTTISFLFCLLVVKEVLGAKGVRDGFCLVFSNNSCELMRSLSAPAASLKHRLALLFMKEKGKPAVFLIHSFMVKLTFHSPVSPLS